MTPKELQSRTKRFAHQCVRTALSFPKNALGYHLRGQLIRAATSVAANYRAACLAQSKASFIHKVSIVLEEADECVFWLEFARDEKIIGQELTALQKEAGEILAIFYTIRKNSRKKE